MVLRKGIMWHLFREYGILARGSIMHQDKLVKLKVVVFHNIRWGWRQSTVQWFQKSDDISRISSHSWSGWIGRGPWSNQSQCPVTDGDRDLPIKILKQLPTIWSSFQRAAEIAFQKITRRGLCKSRCFTNEASLLVANHRCKWIPTCSADSLVKKQTPDNWDLRFKMISKDLQGMTSDRYQLQWNSCMWAGPMFLCRAKEELGWGGGEDTLCLFSPSRLCPALSNSVQLAKVWKRKYPDFVHVQLLKLC